MDILYLVPDPDCPASRQALDLLHNQQFVQFRRLNLPGIPSIGREAPWHRCLCLSIPPNFFEASRLWSSLLSSRAYKNAVHLPEPVGQPDTAIKFGFAFRPQHTLPGPDLFVINCASDCNFLLHDPVNIEEQSNNEMLFVDHGVPWYLNNVRRIQFGSYSFLTYMKINEREASALPVMELQKVAEPLIHYNGKHTWKRLDCLLGRGAFGEVWLQREMHTGALKAVKQIRIESTNALQLKQAREEMSRAKTLDHENIVKTFIGNETDDIIGGKPAIRIDIVMDPYPISLQAMIDASIAKHYFRQMGIDISEGLEYLQSCKIFHRDLKPDNVLVKFPVFHQKVLSMESHERFRYLDFKQNFRFCISDFGFSRQAEHFCQSYFGTPAYMAPEIRAITRRSSVKGQYTNAVDIYSFGMLIFDVLDHERFISLLQRDGCRTHSYVQRWAAGRHQKSFIWSLVSGMITTTVDHRPHIHAIRDAFVEGRFILQHRPVFELLPIVEELTLPTYHRTAAKPLTLPQKAPLHVPVQPVLPKLEQPMGSTKDGLIAVQAGYGRHPKVDRTRRDDRLIAARPLAADNVFLRAEQYAENNKTMFNWTINPEVSKKAAGAYKCSSSKKLMKSSDSHDSAKGKAYGGITKKSGSSARRGIKASGLLTDRKQEALLRSLDMTTTTPSKKILAFILAIPSALGKALMLLRHISRAFDNPTEDAEKYKLSINIKVPGAFH
ncbi:Serine/threonine-protein kinase T3-like protein [Elsinoe fawcettii]|nr:Serine/threonine-protein kinase T3-like protein [Elsinoe fawcettii]